MSQSVMVLHQDLNATHIIIYDEKEKRQPVKHEELRTAENGLGKNEPLFLASYILQTCDPCLSHHHLKPGP